MFKLRFGCCLSSLSISSTPLHFCSYPVPSLALSGMENIEGRNLDAVCESAVPAEDDNYEPQSLCLCLTCGNAVGYLESDAESHFQETGHVSYLELFSQRAWDFLEGNFASRLRKPQPYGKLDNYGSGQQVHQTTYPLTNEMEWQQSQIEKDAAEQQSSREDRKGQEKLKQLRLKLFEVEEETKNIKEKYTQKKTEAEKLANDLKEEQELNKRLSEDQKSWKERLEETEAKLQAEQQRRNQEVRDLKEQIADLKYHLSGQEVVAARQELQDGQVFAGEGSSPTHQLKRPRRKKKKR